MAKWQERWTQVEGVTAWTKRIIPSVGRWVGSGPGHTDYFITQILTGHECLKTYVRRIRKSDGEHTIGT